MFMEENLIGQLYLDVIKPRITECLRNQIEPDGKLLLDERNSPLHYALNVRNCGNETFPELNYSELS